MGAKDIKLLYYGSHPIVYQGAGYYKFISKGIYPFIEVLKKFFDIEVFTWSKRANYKISVKRVYVIDSLSLIYNIIKKSIDKDILVILGYPALFEFIVFLIISKIRGIPLIVRESHWYWPSTKISRFLWYIYVNLLKFVDGLICPGKASYRFWKSKGFRRVYIVHFYALEAVMKKCDEKKLESLRNRFNVSNGFKILYLGRLIKKKGVDVIIKAVARLIRRSNVNIFLIIAGDGPEKSALVELAEQLNIRENVIFIGSVPEEYKECIYKLADAFVYTPIMVEIPEEWPIAPLEAMSVGLPTIVSNIIGSLPDIGEGILVVRQQNIDELEKVLEEVVVNEELRKNLSLKAIKTYKKLVNEKLVYKEFLEALIEIVKSRRNM